MTVSTPSASELSAADLQGWELGEVYMDGELVPMMQRVDGGQFVSRTAATAIIASQANRLEEFRDLCLSTASDAGEAQLRVRALRALLSEAEKVLTTVMDLNVTAEASFEAVEAFLPKLREATK
jgi:hypothetical protein